MSVSLELLWNRICAIGDEVHTVHEETTENSKEIAVISERLNNHLEHQKSDTDKKLKKTDKKLKDYEGFQCKNCKKQHRRIPLQGICECGGPLEISYQGSTGNKIVNV